ncbi:hypothetical protein GDO81_002969 [Engystomops pustulosus]|uniref:Secreted protein n=1 Tax=Engystomops pustulosus TaxID=76066 RepID=A0AAV7DNY8_ENGPU|nr:hypothetical protein GDO81_002969 [Engystomops pustulosus]
MVSIVRPFMMHLSVSAVLLVPNVVKSPAINSSSVIVLDLVCIPSSVLPILPNRPQFSLVFFTHLRANYLTTDHFLHQEKLSG